MCSNKCLMHDECFKNVRDDVKEIKCILFSEPGLCKLQILTETDLKIIHAKIASLNRKAWFIIITIIGNMISLGVAVYLSFFKLIPAILKLLERIK